jgi:hypothetical protein
MMMILPPAAKSSPGETLVLKRGFLRPSRFALAGVAAISCVFFLASLLAQDPPPSPQPAAGQPAKIEPGVIVLVKTEGNVRMADEKNPGGAPVAAGALVPRGATIITAKNSSADMLFSNGAAFHVGQDSKFSVEQFEQEHWTWVKNKPEWDKLKAEPTASDTRLKLEYGSIVGNVKPLAAKSKMTISTPLGVAGIRGTTWSLTVTRNAAGQLQVNLSVPEGAVTFAGTNGATSTRTVEGTSTIITANLAPDGSLVVAAQSETPLNPDQAAVIRDIIRQVEAQTAIFAQVADNPSMVQNTALSGDTGTVNGPAAQGTGQGAGQAPGGFSTSTTFPGSSSGGGGGGGGGPIPTPTPTPKPTPTPTPVPTPTPIISP